MARREVTVANEARGRRTVMGHLSSRRMWMLWSTSADRRADDDDLGQSIWIRGNWWAGEPRAPHRGAAVLAVGLLDQAGVGYDRVRRVREAIPRVPPSGDCLIAGGTPRSDLAPYAGDDVRLGDPPR